MQSNQETAPGHHQRWTGPIGTSDAGDGDDTWIDPQVDQQVRQIYFDNGHMFKCTFIRLTSRSAWIYTCALISKTQNRTSSNTRIQLRAVSELGGASPAGLWEGVRKA